MSKVLVSVSTVEFLQDFDYEGLTLEQIKEIRDILSGPGDLSGPITIKVSRADINKMKNRQIKPLPKRMNIKDLVWVEHEKVEEFNNNLIKKLDRRIKELEEEDPLSKLKAIILESREVKQESKGKPLSKMEKFLFESLAEILPTRVKEYSSINLARFSDKDLQLLLENVKFDYHYVLLAINEIHENKVNCEAVSAIGKPEYLYIIDELQKRIERALFLRNIFQD